MGVRDVLSLSHLYDSLMLFCSELHEVHTCIYWIVYVSVKIFLDVLIAQHPALFFFARAAGNGLPVSTLNGNTSLAKKCSGGPL